MRSNVVIRAMVFVLLIGVAGAASAGAPKSPTATTGKAALSRADDGWPDTPAGRRARRWVEAFSSGEDSMRAFMKNDMADPAPGKPRKPPRLENYRKLRERFGDLILASIDGATPGEVRATLLASDASTHKFVFKVQTQPPYKMVSVSMVEHSHGHFGFGHGGS